MCCVQVKRIPGSSGRLHMTEEGEWEWSDEECAEEDQQKVVVAEPAHPETKEPVCQVLRFKE